MSDTTQAEKAGPIFNIQRIYVKGSSWESPWSPLIFKEEWKPTVSVDLQTKTDKIEEDLFDVCLQLTVTVKMDDKTAFLVEVNQAGIFMAKGFSEEQMGSVLGSLCPNILYPYAREAISDTVTRGGFPQLLLAPVNFDALYAQHLEQQAKGSSSAASANE